jgi:hypothetical protein
LLRRFVRNCDMLALYLFVVVHGPDNVLISLQHDRVE